MNKTGKKTFTDKNAFEKILHSYYTRLKPYLKADILTIPVQFIGYKDETAQFKISSRDINPEDNNELTIYTRSQNGEEFAGHFEILGTKEKDIILLRPKLFEFYSCERREPRINLLDEKFNRLIVTLSNIISDFLIKNNLADNVRKLEKIKEAIKVKLDTIFDSIIVYFSNEGISHRYKYFTNNIKPLFIKNIYNEEENKDKEMYSDYIENIFKNDHKLQTDKKMQSEISVPIIYKMKMPYGFIRINNEKSIDEKYFSVVKKMAVITDKLIMKHQIIRQYEDRFRVSDMSKNGLGIIFKDRKYIKYFKTDSLIYFDLFLPNNLKANILGYVKNISFAKNNYIKIGCEIHDIDALSEVYYDEFLEELEKV